LSITTKLVFVLRRTGILGELTSGRVERDGAGRLTVYHGSTDKINDYISGSNLRSWCVLGPDGKPMLDWQQIASDEDRQKILAR
jgi:hypothetical protein